MIHRDDLIALSIALPTAFLTTWGIMDILNRAGLLDWLWFV